MKKINKVMALLLSAVMAIGLTACGGDNSDTSADTTKTEATDTAKTENSDTTTAEETEIDSYTALTDEDGNVYDLGGMEIIMADWYSSGEKEEPTNAYEEARAEYEDWIQETYNFTIRSEAVSTFGDMPEDFVKFATTGGEKNYIFALYHGPALVSAVNSGLMYDLSTLDCLDFSEEKWDATTTDLMTVGDSLYAMRGVASGPGCGIFFNKRLLTEAGIDPETLYDLQENGEWTWEKFEELCQQVQADTDNDGIIDRYAMTNFHSNLYLSSIWSNGGDIIGKDADGYYYNALESDATMEALNWALDMISNYEMIYPEDAAWDYTFTAFRNGMAAFSCAAPYESGNMTEMEDDFGYVCFPMGPRLTDYVNYQTDTVYAIPACYDKERAWKIAFVYNLWTDPVPGYEDYAAWKTDYYSTFRDTESVDLTITRMMETGVASYHDMIPNLSLGEDLIWGISKDSTPAQQAEAIRNTWAAYLDAANSKSN